MKHKISPDDQDFRERVEACSFPVSEFDHRAHLRLAYVYLVENDADISNLLVRQTLNRLLEYNNIEPAAKYHETLTRAWLLAVHHFMNNTEVSGSADEFIDKNPKILDSKIMMTHYSSERLFSDAARKSFVEPDLEPIPIYSR